MHKTLKFNFELTLEEVDILFDSLEKYYLPYGKEFTDEEVYEFNTKLDFLIDKINKGISK